MGKRAQRDGAVEMASGAPEHGKADEAQLRPVLLQALRHNLVPHFFRKRCAGGLSGCQPEVLVGPPLTEGELTLLSGRGPPSRPCWLRPSDEASMGSAWTSSGVWQRFVS